MHTYTHIYYASTLYQIKLRAQITKAITVGVLRYSKCLHISHWLTAQEFLPTAPSPFFEFIAGKHIHRSARQKWKGLSRESACFWNPLYLARTWPPSWVTLTTKNERGTKTGFLHDLVATTLHTLMDFRDFYEANHSASTLVWTQIKKSRKHKRPKLSHCQCAFFSQWSTDLPTSLWQLLITPASILSHMFYLYCSPS